jgi:outer membrane lipoprotein-sorting protein
MKTSLFLLASAVILLIVMVYQFFIENHFKAEKLLTEIESMKIDSTKVLESGKTVNYDFWVGGKYKISLTHDRKEPFVQKDRQQVRIKDFDGEILFYYDTEWNTTLRPWESDYIRLTKYLNIQHR